MKKMKTILGAMASAAVCLLALAGCTREGMEKETGEVKFGFTSVAALTRTEFENAATPSGITKEQVRWNIGWLSGGSRPAGALSGRTSRRRHR